MSMSCTLTGYFDAITFSTPELGEVVGQSFEGEEETITMFYGDPRAICCDAGFQLDDQDLLEACDFIVLEDPPGTVEYSYAE